ncbi:MAG: class I SAM-dependent methyltransferase, partial [Lachnospiraceae bacterium]|nr:class I SAM-dependent methyltransferase [Lachnospiraceae bacterium]
MRRLLEFGGCRGNGMEKAMESYTGFAGVYDELMDATPYGEWCQRIVDYIEKYGVSRPVRGRMDDGQTLDEALESEKNLVLDLGCGTGTLTELMARRGYDMIGIDLSCEMLLLALEKKEAAGLDIMYFCQDMRELDMYSTIGTIYSVCDSVNYLLEDEDVIQ